MNDKQKSILIRVTAPEGYEDCDDEIVLADFVEETRKAWKVELVKEEE